MLKKFSRKQTISFKEKVFQVVKRIPKGKVLSYKIVAKLAGFPRAWRAVGNALNKNPNPKTIPCHRVIKSNRRIGGYKYGVERKISLLRREGVIIRNKRIVN